MLTVISPPESYGMREQVEKILAGGVMMLKIPESQRDFIKTERNLAKDHFFYSYLRHQFLRHKFQKRLVR